LVCADKFEAIKVGHGFKPCRKKILSAGYKTPPYKEIGSMYDAVLHRAEKNFVRRGIKPRPTKDLVADKFESD